MRKKTQLLALLLLVASWSFGQKDMSVSANGQLRIDGIHVVNEKGEPVQLKGMSLFWSQWMGQFYNGPAVRWLKKDWGCSVIRAAMGVEKGGYLTKPESELEKLEMVIKAAIKADMYVIIDYHAHEAHEDTEAAKYFFGKMAKKYGKHPNVIYELFNEPVNVKWDETIKPYCETVIAEIRKYDPDNIIVCGTPNWSQLVDVAAADPIDDKNVAYTIHFYAATHKQELRDKAQAAIDLGACLFVTEFGTSPASGDGPLDLKECDIWFDFLDKYSISWCNWSIADKDETSSSLKPGADEWGRWKDDDITESGHYIRSKIKGETAPATKE